VVGYVLTRWHRQRTEYEVDWDAIRVALSVGFELRLDLNPVPAILLVLRRCKVAVAATLALTHGWPVVEFML
jgi:hypothetical protein